MINTFENFYIIAPVALLTQPLTLSAFANDDGTYKTIPEYLATYNHTVDRFSLDGTMFCKGFGFTLATINEMQTKFVDYGLTLGTDIFILNSDEVAIELAKSTWTDTTTVV